MQAFKTRHRLAASVLETPATRLDSSESLIDSNDRIESNAHASSSNGAEPRDGAEPSNGFYDGAGAGEVELISKDVDAVEVELRACEVIDDVLEIVRDEGDIMTGSNWAAALKR